MPRLDPERPWHCPECKEIYPEYAELKEHIREAHPDQWRAVYNPLCAAAYVLRKVG